MKGIRIFIRNVGSAVKSIFRNFSLSAASIICTTITLLIVGIAMLITQNVNNFTKDIEKTLSIIVYVDKTANEEDLNIIKSKMLEIKNIKSDEIVIKDKEKLKEETLAKTDPNSALYTLVDSWTVENNPLKPEFVLTVKDIKDMDSTIQSIKSIEKVDNVQYSEDVVKKMIPTFNILKKATFIIIGGLIIVTTFLICNTIRLTIFARRQEIEIMRLVGTSNFVIKLPFVIEGLFLGLLGSIIPIISIIWGYIIAYDKLDHHLFSNLITLLKPMPFTVHISFMLVLLGSLIGMVGSYITVRKYLKI